MPAVTELILLLIFPVACICGDVVIVTHNTTINLTCRVPSDLRVPRWFTNGTEVATTGDRYSVSTSNVVDKTATLTINGNLTRETVKVYCEVLTTERRFVHMHNTTLIFQGRLPSPESVHIKEHLNSSTIGWKPPYSAMNNESDIIHVDPRITHYTAYITDNYTGNIIVKENVTETQFNIQQDDVLCPMCQVSAWNAGGEGEMSEPVQDNTPRVPRNVTAESITVRGTVKPNVVHILMNDVDIICTSRIPEFFLITLMTSAGSAFNETRQHQPGQAVADFNISLPESVDVCTLHVRISAGNSAGMSAPSEAVEVECSGDSTDSTTTASATTVLTATSTGSGSEDNRQQGVSTTLIVIIIGVIAAVGVILIVAVGIMCCLKHKSKNSKVKHSDQTDNHYTGSPSLGGSLYKPPVAEAVYVTTEQTTSRPVARDPEHTANWMPTLDSAPSTLQTSVAMAPEIQAHTSYSPTSSPSTVSGRSDDLLLPPSPPAPARSPNMVYAHINVQQTQVPPPAHDDHVQYAQLKQQDKM